MIGAVTVTADRSRESSVWRRPTVALRVIALVAFGLPFAEGRWLFPLGSSNHDEPMYTFAARLLRTGHLTLPASFASYRPWASGVHGGRLVLKYTPVWPGVLAAGDAIGSTRIAVGATAATAVVLTAMLGRELFDRWTEGLLAATMLVLSPLFLVQAGTFLSYLFQLVLDLAVVLLVLGALRRWPAHGPPPRGVIGRLVAGGAVWGIAVFARQYDAFLIAVPLVVAAVGLGRHKPRRLRAWIGWSALGAAIPLAGLFVYNWALLGGPLRNSFTITGKYDTLLFGRRGVSQSTTFTFTAHDAALSFTRNLTRLPSWSFGGVLLVVLAGFGLWRSRRRGPAVWAVAGIAVSFAVGYALFWSPFSIVALWRGTRTMGPFYHFALLIPLTLFGAAGLVAVFDRTRGGAVALVAVMVAVTSVGLVTKVDRNLIVTREYQAAKRLIDSAHVGHAVLFMEDRGTNGFESAEPFLENRPDLDQPVIYAADNELGNLRVMREFPDRTAFRHRSEIRAGDDLLHPTRFIEELHVGTATAVTLRFRIVNTMGATTVTIRCETAEVSRSVVLDTHSRKGATYTFEWILSAATPSPQSPVTTIALPTSSSGTAAIEADFGNPGKTTDRYQLRYPYAVTGRRVSVLRPGRGQYLFQYRNAVWLNQDIAPTLTEML